MTFRRKLLTFVLVLLSTIIMSSCDTAQTESPPALMTITIDHCVFEEVEQNKIEELGLIVDSCSGLAIVGEIDAQGGKSYGTAYAYPDQRYPNLVVVFIDEKPTVFQFTNFTGKLPVDIAEIRNIYGLSTADSISEISIRSQQFDEKAEIVSIITEKEEIVKFFDAFNDLSPTGAGYSESSDYYPAYLFEVGLSNEFSISLDYYPKIDMVYCGNVFYRCGDSMLKWINAQRAQKDGGRFYVLTRLPR